MNYCVTIGRVLPRATPTQALWGFIDNSRFCPPSPTSVGQGRPRPASPVVVVTLNPDFVHPRS